MAEIKKEIKPLSEWIKFELETDLIDPPEIELRLAPIYSIDAIDYFDEKGRIVSFRKMVKEGVFECVREWNLKRGGKEIPLNSETKERHLYPLLGAKLKGKPQILGLAIWMYATTLDNFVKD
ncbi:hypothetical protein KAT51_04185 [bacterium]|nr:hypothetical protein [bacterium]